MASLKQTILANSRVESRGWKDLTLFGIVEKEMKELKDSATLKGACLVAEDSLYFLVAEQRGTVHLPVELFHLLLGK